MTIFNPAIIGHADVISVFQNFFLKEKIPQAIIFDGIDGIGKDFFADEIVKSLRGNLNDSTTHTRFAEPLMKFVIALPRGRNELSHDDPLEKLEKSDFKNVLTEIEEKRKNPYHRISIERANNIKINSIRDINKFLTRSSAQDEHRIVLISHAELMNEESQNSLLKNLEEPPERVTFILTTSNLSQLRPTIISRCWYIKFSPLKKDEVSRILIEHFDIEPHLANGAALLANGSVLEALELVNNDLDFFQSTLIDFLRSALAGNFQSSNHLLSQLLKSDEKKNFNLVVKMILFWLADVKRDVAGLNNFSFAEHTETMQKFNTRYSEVKISNFIASIENLSNTVMNNNLNLNIATHRLIFELSTLIKQI